jgi:hypothetical protein
VPSGLRFAFGLTKRSTMQKVLIYLKHCDYRRSPRKSVQLSWLMPKVRARRR